MCLNLKLLKYLTLLPPIYLSISPIYLSISPIYLSISPIDEDKLQKGVVVAVQESKGGEFYRLEGRFLSSYCELLKRCVTCSTSFLLQSGSKSSALQR